MRSATTLLLCLLPLTGCEDPGGSSPVPRTATAAAAVAPGPRLILQLGPDLPPAPAQRIEDLLRRTQGRSIVVVGPTADTSAEPAGSLVLALGDTRTTRDLIPAADVQALGPEGFVLRSAERGGVLRIATDGNAPAPTPHALGVKRGLLYGAYALLEELGFGFLHPLAPTIPDRLTLPTAPLDRREAPRWPRRGWHLHTMHPLELTELLNGWGPGGPQDDAGWRAQLPEWEAFCEWAVANRQNEVEWVLLGATSWQAFADGPVRQARLRELTDVAHAWGLAAGADAPLALRQQHSWTLVRRTGQLADEVQQIERGVDYLMGCGFDFVSTELGFSEFTKPDDRRMLAWLDALTGYVASRYGKETLAKAHVSQGQTADHFVDPTTGGPLNFNFLTHYADPRLGVLPHTVQHYGLDDPAPTYGATDFQFMRRFLQEQVGRRPVIWYPETAYWVSFDVDVPLFLPVYAERRLHDLRLLAEDERAGRMGRGPHTGKRMDGQMVFSSGWEWGYWLNDVVAARAAWDPREQAPDDEAALRALLLDALRPFGPATAPLVDALLGAAREQRELLILGRVNGRDPARIERRSGQAYLQGWDTWDEVMGMAGLVPGLQPALTQPAKLGLVDMRRPWWRGGPDYRGEVRPLLEAMAQTFTARADALLRLGPGIPPAARPLYDDLSDAACMTALRARQVFGLYDYVDLRADPARALPRLAEARAALDQAAVVVGRREAAYRVPADRIAGWRENPTAYPFTYLWTARSLFYWWRDEGKAVDAPWSPAYLNVIDPLDVAFGEGFWIPLGQLVRDAGPRFGLDPITDLLGTPRQEPTFPQAGLRQRP